MTILFPKPPADFGETMMQHLHVLAEAYRSHPSGHPMGSAFIAERTEMPLEVFSLTVTDILAHRTPSEAKPEGWQVFLSDTPPIRLAEVTVNKQGSMLFSGLITGTQVSRLWQLLKSLQETSEFEGNTPVARVLRVSSLYIQCLWLANSDPIQDIFFFLPKVFPPFEDGVQYRLREFLQLLQVAAARVTLRSSFPKEK